MANTSSGLSNTTTHLKRVLAMAALAAVPLANTAAAQTPSQPPVSLQGTAGLVSLRADPAPQTSSRPPAVPNRKWEIAVHGGWLLRQQSTDGTSALPPPGAPFMLGGRPGRRVTSYYFGDGAVLLNEVATALNVGSSRLSPLDAVLSSPGIKRRRGGSAGFRMTRILTDRLSAEFSFDFGAGRLVMTDETVAGIEASRATFMTAWNAVLVPRGLLTAVSVTSTAAIRTGVGSHLLTTGAVSINLTKRRPVVPYATVGLGLDMKRGETPSATLVGNYRFAVLMTNPIDDSDTVVVRFTSRRTSPVALIGAGVKWELTSRSGLRVDTRWFISENTSEVRLDATPHNRALTPRGGLSLTTSPTISFLNFSTTSQFATFSGPAITNFQTFRGTGSSVQIQLTAGWFVRF